MTNKERVIAHKETIDKYGQVANVNKAIQEFNELIEELRDWKIGFKNKENIIEEIADCYNMLDKMQIMFKVPASQIKDIKVSKMKRTVKRL